MGSDRTPNQMRGFISPLKLTNESFWMDQTSAQQNTPRAGVPVASQNSPMVLQASGLMEEGDTVQVRTVRAGHVGLGGRSQFQWRPGTSGDYYGRDSYNFNTWWERVIGSTTQKFIPRDCLQATDGSVYIAVEKQQSGNFDVMVLKRATDGTYSTPISLYTSDNSLAEDFLFSGLCQLEDGSIILVHWTIDPDDELAQINVHRTEDDGATWSQVSTEAVPFDNFNLSIENKGSFGAGTAGVDLSDIRVRSIGGQTIMTAHIIKHNTSLGNSAAILLQYLSTNQGLTFELIAENNDAGYFSHGLQVVNGAFHISYIELPASPRVLVIGALASASSPISSSIKYDISTDTDFQTGTAFTHEGELSVWIDTDGKYYAIARQIQGTSSGEDTTQIFQSTDGGKNWSGMGIGGNVFTNEPAGQINNFSTAPVLHLTNFVGCSQGGEGLIFHNTAGTGASSYNEIL